MARTSKNVRQRLRVAALELFRAKGFDGTTAAEIASRVGVTQRTFFRHFADKREVLFDEDALRTALARGVADAPPDLTPLQVLHSAFGTISPLLQENRELALFRREIIDATSALRERELAKAAALVDLLAALLRDRGVEAHRSGLLAQIAATAGSDAVAAWLDDPSVPYGEHLDRTFRYLEEIFAAPPFRGAEQGFR